MDQQIGPPRWVPWVVGSVLALLVAFVAYSVGLQQSAAAGADLGRRWHVGFPFGIFFLFWFLALFMRGLFWGGCWSGPWRYRRYRHDWYDVHPGEWDEWHRRA